MKKIKALLTIPALVAVFPATVSLSSCGNKTNTSDPVIDPTLSDKVSISITRNTDGSATCKLTLTASESSKKITTISVKIGSTTLTEGTDYSVGNTNDNSVNVTIFKSALDKYQGSIVITPKISEFNGIDTELTKTTFIINEETFTSNQLKVYKSYDGTRGEFISWSDDKLSIWYKGSDITDDFIESGFECSELGTHSFTIKYNNQLSKTISITVAKKTYTVSCSTEANCVTVSSSVVAEDGAKWGDVAPTITPKGDVSLDSINLKWEDEDGNEMDEDYSIEKSFNAKLIVSFNSTSTQNTIECDTEGDSSKYNCNCYIPSSSEQGTAPWIDSNNTWIYTFYVNLDNCTGNFQYFWIAIKDASYEAGGRLLTLGLDNIISIKHNGSEIQKSDLSFYTMNGGTYMKYTNTPFTTGTMEIKYRSLTADTTKNIIPGYEADGK